MIKKLRLKFILINMSLVSVVLVIVFGVLCFSSYQQLQNDARSAMSQAIDRTGGKTPPKMKLGGERPQDMSSSVPVLCALLNDSGGVVYTSGEDAEMSDAVLNQAVKLVWDSGQKEGTLSSLGLRYLTKETPDGTVIAFADSSAGMDSMKSLVLTSLLVGAGALTAFFLISLFLSSLALRPVEKAWKQQRQFVADASHELKTPLTIILADTGILLSHRQNTIEQQIKWVEYIQEESNRMKKLVDDLLFLAKSDDAGGRVLRTPFNFSDLVQNCILSFEPVAFENDVVLESSVEPNLILAGDEGQLRQLTVILLDNACKYAGKKGKVTIRLERGQDGAKLSVSNTGTPIPTENLEHLFERFYRVDSSRTRRQGGYGLGLAIAKSITDKHRGKITVASARQEGTSFTVFLPLK